MKKVIISEQQEKELIKKLNEEVYQMPVDKKMNKPYTINPDKVLVVKKFLDSNFQKGNAEFIGNNGRLAKVRIISIPDSNGESLRDLTPDNLVDLLIDRFKNMFLDQGILKHLFSSSTRLSKYLVFKLSKIILFMAYF